MRTKAQEGVYLNEVARRSFRDTADMDYISARLAYRSALLPQFHWAGLQAMEKYFKAILLFNRIPAKDIGHSLSSAMELAKQLPFPLQLSQSSLEIIEHLDSYGGDRYLIYSYAAYGPLLTKLDKAVWELRRYCKVLNYELDMGTMKKNMLTPEINRIEALEGQPIKHVMLTDGLLEAIIKSRKHPSRPGLLWNNPYFGLRRRQTVSMRLPMQMVNSPLTLNPEILDSVSAYVHIPKEAKKIFGEENTRRQKRRS
ncbi:hypothetical protein [Cupriavidus taiwanensis]|uniref:hypothetical protein n=1 Tax=Cupriavidus taiwanensis TaxID=164546 RepID=UPI0039C46221